MCENKKAVILVNVGSPDQPKLQSVRRFLFEFLNDSRVIDLPFLLRKFLVNLIIVPLRARKSTSLYKQLWNENGSPLKHYQEKVKNRLSDILGDEYVIYSAMRYKNPHLLYVLKEIKNKKFGEIVLLPLYPQYASSTTGSVYEMFMKEVQKWEVIPKIHLIDQFYNHPLFIEAFAERVRKHNIEEYDHIIFSYHGLPDRQIRKIHPETDLKQCLCEKQMPDFGRYCYKATCYETTRLLADKLNIPEEKYTISFQSRLSKKWLSPFTNQVLIEKAQQGVKNILVLAPAFVADCLETIIEIGIEYKKLFVQSGGQKLDLVDSLNDSETWIKGLSDIIRNKA